MNLNINCYDIRNQLTEEESIKGTSFIIQLPYKAQKLLNVIDNLLYVAVDLDSLETSYIQLTFIPVDWDIKGIDKNLNESIDSYNYLGTYKDADSFVFLFAKILSHREER